MQTTKREAERLEDVLRRNRMTPEEVERLGENVPVFDYEEWEREAPPATPEELADWEEFLRERQVEREAELAREVGVELSL